MKLKLYLATTTLLFNAWITEGQGNLVFDQQSSPDEHVFPNGTGLTIQQHTQFGQSFTPSLSAIDFIRLNLNDKNPNNSLGAVLHVNLRTNAINGPILATSVSVSLADSFSGVAYFFFASSPQLTPGVVYFFEPMIQAGDQWNTLAGEYNYSGGTMFADGFQSSASDFWFREGIIVPEPAAAVLLLGGGVFTWFVRKKQCGC